MCRPPAASPPDGPDAGGSDDTATIFSLATLPRELRQKINRVLASIEADRVAKLERDGGAAAADPGEEGDGGGGWGAPVAEKKKSAAEMLASLKGDRMSHEVVVMLQELLADVRGLLTPSSGEEGGGGSPRRTRRGALLAAPAAAPDPALRALAEFTRLRSLAKTLNVLLPHAGAAGLPPALAAGSVVTFLEGVRELLRAARGGDWPPAAACADRRAQFEAALRLLRPLLSRPPACKAVAAAPRLAGDVFSLGLAGVGALTAGLAQRPLRDAACHVLTRLAEVAGGHSRAERVFEVYGVHRSECEADASEVEAPPEAPAVSEAELEAAAAAARGAAAPGSSRPGSAAGGSRPGSAAGGSRPGSAAGGSRPGSAAGYARKATGTASARLGASAAPCSADTRTLLPPPPPPTRVLSGLRSRDWGLLARGLHEKNLARAARERLVTVTLVAAGDAVGTPTSGGGASAARTGSGGGGGGEAAPAPAGGGFRRYAPPSARRPPPPQAQPARAADAADTRRSGVEPEEGYLMSASEARLRAAAAVYGAGSAAKMAGALTGSARAAPLPLPVGATSRLPPLHAPAPPPPPAPVAFSSSPFFSPVKGGEHIMPDDMLEAIAAAPQPTPARAAPGDKSFTLSELEPPMPGGSGGGGGGGGHVAGGALPSDAALSFFRAQADAWAAAAAAAAAGVLPPLPVTATAGAAFALPYSSRGPAGGAQKAARRGGSRPGSAAAPRGLSGGGGGGGGGGRPPLARNKNSGAAFLTAPLAMPEPTYGLVPGWAPPRWSAAPFFPHPHAPQVAAWTHVRAAGASGELFVEDQDP
jgi:hypothetical protein